jgi:hypothetical protein
MYASSRNYDGRNRFRVINLVGKQFSRPKKIILVKLLTIFEKKAEIVRECENKKLGISIFLYSDYLLSKTTCATKLSY